jgi:preprotein translocase subunit SecY
MLVNFMTVGLYFTTIFIFYGHLIYFVLILVCFSRFGMLYQERSGNPVTTTQQIENQWLGGWFAFKKH